MNKLPDHMDWDDALLVERYGADYIEGWNNCVSMFRAALSHAAGQEAVIRHAWLHWLSKDDPEVEDDYEIHDTEQCPNQPCPDCIPVRIVLGHDAPTKPTNPAEIGRKLVGGEAAAGQWELVPSGFLIDGPNGTAMVFCRAFIEPKIAALCENNGDDPEDYTATELYMKAWRGRAVDMPITPEQPPASAEVGRDERRQWFDAGWEKCKLLTPGEECRFFASGPEGSFFTKTLVEAQNLLDVACFDSDEWTVTDLLDPVAASSGRNGDTT